MARETTVEVDIEVSTKYSEKIKKAEERLKKVNKVASKMNTPKKPLTEMEKYQQSIDKTNRLLQKLEKQQGNLSKFIRLEAVIKAKIKISKIEDITNSGNSATDEKKPSRYEKVKNILGGAKNAIGNADDFIELPSKLKKYPVIGKYFSKNSESESDGSGSGDMNMFDVIQNVGRKIPEIYSQINSKLATMVQKTGTVFGKLFNGIKINFSNLKNGIKGLKSGGFKGIGEKIISASSKLLEAGKKLGAGTLNLGAKAISEMNPVNIFQKIKSIDFIGMFKGMGTGILSSVKGAFSILAANPLAVILGLVAAFVLLYTNCESFRKVVNDAFQKILPHIMKLVDIVQGVVCAVFQELLSIFEQLKPALFSMLQKGKPLFEMLVNTIIAAINIIIEVIQYLVPVFAQIWEAIKPIVMIALEIIIALIGMAIETITFILQLLIDIFQAVWDALAPIVMFAIDIIVGLITGMIETISFIIQGIVVIITLIWEQIKPIFQMGVEFIIGIWNGFQEFMGGLWSILVSGIQGFANSLKEIIGGAVENVKGLLAGLASNIPGLNTVINLVKGKNYSGTNFWKGGLTYVGERGRELIQYPTGERFMAESKMLMNLPKGTRIFTNSKTEKMLNKNVPRDKAMTVDENNQLKKLGGFNGLSDYTDFKFGGGINYSNVQTDNITINITNTYGNQSSAQIKDTNNDLVRKINEVLFQKEDRKRRVSIG